MSGTTASASFYDGRSSQRRSVEVALGTGLDILENGALVERWEWGTIRRVDAPAGTMRLRSLAANELARLELPDGPAAQEITLKAFALDIGNESKGKLRVVGWSLGAAASIFFLIFYGVPLAAERLAPLIPLSFEARIGDMVEKQVSAIFGSETCSDPEGKAAFVKLVGKLEKASGLALPLRADVLATSVPNAIALPGGRVFLFDGLLRRAENPDEIAGVLAHELGHIAHRDSLRKLIQTGGTSFLFGLFFGDVTGSGAAIFAARSLIDASHSREAETRADTFAITTMRALGRPARPAGDLMQRITGSGKGSTTILSSHPMTAERRDRMEREGAKESGPELLSFGEWRALKNVCRKG